MSAHRAIIPQFNVMGSRNSQHESLSVERLGHTLPTLSCDG